MTNKTILAIDDDPTLLSLVQNVLEQSGFTVILAENGEIGLDKAQNETPDAVLLDRKMPGLTGNEVLKALKENETTKNIPVLILTGDNNIKDLSMSLELGAKDYIVKPFNNENLIKRLKNVL